MPLPVSSPDVRHRLPVRRPLSHRAMMLGTAVVFLTTIANAQDRRARNAITQELERMYELTKMALFEPHKVNKPGGVYVVQADGIQAEVMLQSGTQPTFIVDGRVKASSDSGAGGLLTTVLTGRTREEPRILKKGERVYVTDFSGLGDGLRVEIITVEAFPIIDQGRTRQVSYKAALVFQTADKKFPDISDAKGAKRLIDAFLASEADANAPKTIALGQTMAEVEAVFGKPLTIVNLGEKTIYSYKDIKVTFTNGKVTDVQ